MSQLPSDSSSSKANKEEKRSEPKQKPVKQVHNVPTQGTPIPYQPHHTHTHTHTHSSQITNNKPTKTSNLDYPPLPPPPPHNHARRPLHFARYPLRLQMRLLLRQPLLLGQRHQQSASKGILATRRRAHDRRLPARLPRLRRIRLHRLGHILRVPDSG